MTHNYTPLEAEAALCIWEELLTRTNSLAGDSYSAEIDAVRDRFGSVALRHVSLALAPFVLQVFDLLPESVTDGHAYDWEIVPAILDKVDWDCGPSMYELPEVNAAAAMVAATLEAA